MALIHKFKQGENYFVLDVNTGAVHIVDELVYDLVDDILTRKYGLLIANNAFDGKRIYLVDLRKED